MTEEQIKAELKTFFIALQAWVDEGTPYSKHFYKKKGICYNLLTYTNTFPRDNPIIVCDAVHEVLDYLKGMLGNKKWPFNTDASEYMEDLRSNVIYSNPQRLAFIKEQAHI